jgi:hypothetical protein
MAEGLSTGRRAGNSLGDAVFVERCLPAGEGTRGRGLIHFGRRSDVVAVAGSSDWGRLRRELLVTSFSHVRTPTVVASPRALCS